MASRVSRRQTILRRISRGQARIGRYLVAGRPAWRRAVWGGLAVVSLMLLVAAYSLLGSAGPGWFAMGAVFLLVVFALAGGLLTLVGRILSFVPGFYAWVTLSTLLVLAFLSLTAMSVSLGAAAVGLGALAGASLTGAGVAVLSNGSWARLVLVQRAIAVGELVVGLPALPEAGILSP